MVLGRLLCPTAVSLTNMKPNEGRLQTAEHILAHILENRDVVAKVVIAKFEEKAGWLEVSSAEDLRKIDFSKIQAEVNKVIMKHLPVNKYFVNRVTAESEFDLRRIPSSVSEIRIVEIYGFDKTPCKDPHVENTNEIGFFSLLSVVRVGKDRYRFCFRVD